MPAAKTKKPAATVVLVPQAPDERPPDKRPEPRLRWRVSEFARLNGVSRCTLYRWIKNERVIVRRVGGVVLVEGFAE